MISSIHLVVSALLLTCSQLVHVTPSFCPGSGSEDETFIAPKASLETPSRRRGRPPKLAAGKEAPVKSQRKKWAASQVGPDSFVDFNPQKRSRVQKLHNPTVRAFEEIGGAIGERVYEEMSSLETKFYNLLQEQKQWFRNELKKKDKDFQEKDSAITKDLQEQEKRLRKELEGRDQALEKIKEETFNRISNLEQKNGQDLQEQEKRFCSELEKKGATIRGLLERERGFRDGLQKWSSQVVGSLRSVVCKQQELSARVVNSQPLLDFAVAPPLSSSSASVETRDPQTSLLQLLLEAPLPDWGGDGDFFGTFS